MPPTAEFLYQPNSHDHNSNVQISDRHPSKFVHSMQRHNIESYDVEEPNDTT